MAEDRIRVIMRHLQNSSNNQEEKALFHLTSAHTTSVYSNPSEFQYTIDNSLLTWEQRKFYEENGFIVFRKLIEDDLLEECRQHFVDICEGKASKGNMILMKDVSLKDTNVKGEYLYNKVQDIVWDEVFSKYILHPKILNIVECFTGPNIKAVHSMLISKPPDSGKKTSVHPMHQDLHYFPFRPENRIVAAWTAMENINEDNGCLFVQPGSHKGPLYPHGYPEQMVNKAYHGAIGFERKPIANLVMEKGDTVFFHPLLLHGSGVNKTKGFRKAISCHYAASECHYIDVTGTTQEEIAIEVAQMARRKGLEMSFEDVWRHKSRLARGLEITL